VGQCCVNGRSVSAGAVPTGATCGAVSGRSVSAGAVPTGASCGAMLCLCDAVQFCSERYNQ